MSDKKSIDAAIKQLVCSPAWTAHFEQIVTDTLDGIQENGGDWLEARAAAVEALITVAAKFHVHDIEPIDPMGDPIPGAIDEALRDFEASACIALTGELVACDLMATSDAA